MGLVGFGPKGIEGPHKGVGLRAGKSSQKWLVGKNEEGGGEIGNGEGSAGIED